MSGAFTLTRGTGVSRLVAIGAFAALAGLACAPLWAQASSLNLLTQICA